MNSRTWSSAASSFSAIRRRTSCLQPRVLEPLHDLLEVALDEHPHRLRARDAAGHHVEDLVLVELADGAAVRGRDVVGLDDQRRDRVALGLGREQHLVGLQVGVGLRRLRDDVDQPLVGRPRVAGERALPDRVAGGVAGLVQVGGEEVEVLVALGEVQAGVAHVRALLGGDDVERLLGQAAAEVDRHPLDARVAARSRPAWWRCRSTSPGPQSWKCARCTCAPGQRVQLEGAGVQRLALEVGRQEVLADAALGVLADHGQRVRVLRGARLVDQLDDLDRLLDLDALGHVHEHAAGPERGGAAANLPSS